MRSTELQLGAVVLLAFVAALACGSNSPTGSSAVAPQCARGEFGCQCRNVAFDVGSATPTSSCSESTLSVPMQCCYDLASDGTTTKCDCYTYMCTPTNAGGTVCLCEWVDITGAQRGNSADSWWKDRVATEPIFKDCTATGDGSCCMTNEDGRCDCTSGPAGGPSSGLCESRSDWAGYSKVSSCGTPPTLDCSNFYKRKGPQPSCDGLVWAAPPAPGGGSAGGGSHPECSSDSACSSRCSSGCYECLGGSCNCGYKGVSGCVF